MDQDETPIVHYRVADGVTREILPNGLTLLVKENHSAPVAALLVSAQAGYFHESDRLNGVSHVIEHMIFKGTSRRPEAEQIAREIREIGGVINAGTYYEETSYYAIVPSAHIERAMDIQADAFQNSLFDPEALAKEIEVIVQESLQKRDNPNAMLIESLYALAYDKHRLRRWRIGHPETLRAFTRDDLLDFADRMYRPENITLAVVGDVSADHIKELAHRLWARLPRGEFKPDISPVEPPRVGFRYKRMLGATPQRLLLMAFPAPTILHEDAAPLMILSALLSDGRSARLYRNLKEDRHIVNSAWASYEGFDQMGVFTLGAECIGEDPLDAERALWAEIDKIRREPPAQSELDRIKSRVESRRLYAQEEVLGMARSLATYEALGDYRLMDEMLERLRAVTVEDARRVAETYLQLSVGSLLEYLPEDAAALPTREPAEVECALREEEARPFPAPARITAPHAAPHFHVSAGHPNLAESGPAKVIALPNGGTLLYKARRDLPIVSISALFRGGRRRETRRQSGITNLMLKSAIQGTRSYDAERIAAKIEALGSSIGMSLAPDYFGYGVKLRKEALAEGFGVFAEVMAFPSFPPEEVEYEKQSIFAEYRRQQDNNFSLAFDLFAAACYGEEHPYGLPASGIPQAVDGLEREDLVAWHGSQVVAQNLVVGVVGDLEEEQAVALFADLLPVGPPDAAEWGSVPVPAHDPENYIKTLSHRRKQQTALMLGFPGADIFNNDRYALEILAEIASGMGGRFFSKVRGENALAYQVTGFHRSRYDTAAFLAYVSTSPESEDAARDLLLKECELLGQELVSPQELAAAKAALIGEHAIGTQTFGAQAGELAANGIYGLPPDEPIRSLARINEVTAEEVRNVARRYLVPDRYWLGVVRGGEQPE